MTEPRDRPGDLTDDNIEAVSDSFPSYQQCAVCKADRILDLGGTERQSWHGLVLVVLVLVLVLVARGKRSERGTGQRGLLRG
jgi:hypothetical protein